jgi:outer membrane protein assembly factor BamB
MEMSCNRYWPDRCRVIVFVATIALVAFMRWPLQASAADWPQFLGPTRNGIYAGEALASSWPHEGPPVLWQKSVGQGFSGPVVQDGKLILFHRLADQERVECLDASKGTTFWKFEYPTSYQDDFGFDEGPRATPSMDHDKVVTFGAEGALHCINLADGKLVWSVSCKEQFRAPKGFFGAACSPLIVDRKVLLNIGGTAGAGIVALDENTGRVLWQVSNDEASYSSPMLATIDAKPAALFFTRSGLVALNPQDGQVHYEFPWRSRSHASVNAATPLVVGDAVFLSASYGTGAILLRAHDGKLEKSWASDDVLSNHYSTCVYREGFLYGFHGRQEFGQSLRCVEFRTGKVRWSKENFGAGTVTLATDRLLVLKESGELLLLEASPQQYKELARSQVLPTGVRAYPAIADGRFFARSKDKLVSLDLISH